MNQLSEKRIKKFQETIYRHTAEYGRDFPWRKTTSPYRIWVSEMMLQQTQTDRVVRYYTKFIRRYPSVKKLAAASLGEVIKQWQGLGYNRRAKFLHQAARIIVEEYHGRLPRIVSQLEQLPGIGPYTARAIAAFAYDQPTVFIETNIRSVYIHEFFELSEAVSDAELLPLIEQTIDREKSGVWYQALMDYGAWLKKEHTNPSRKSSHYTKQTQFKGSDREVRGAIIRLLADTTSVEHELLFQLLKFPRSKIKKNLTALIEEGFVDNNVAGYRLPT